MYSPKEIIVCPHCNTQNDLTNNDWAELENNEPFVCSNCKKTLYEDSDGKIKNNFSTRFR